MLNIIEFYVHLVTLHRAALAAEEMASGAEFWVAFDKAVVTGARVTEFFDAMPEDAQWRVMLAEESANKGAGWLAPDSVWLETFRSHALAA